MAKLFVFSVELNGQNQTIKLGSYRKTEWFYTPKYYNSHDFNGEKSQINGLDFSRSDGNGNLEINVTLHFQKRSVILWEKKFCTYLHYDTKQFHVPIDPVLVKPLKKEQLKGTIVIYDDSDEDESNSTDSGCTSSKLLNDFLSLLNNPDSFADATLKCGSVSIPVHRAILSIRSPVFATMFKTQMQEGRDGVVDIVDIDHDVLQAMLRYIYSGKTDNSTDSLAGDLLFAADKYQLEELKLSCVEKLKSKMVANNVFRSLVIGDLLDSSLKVHAMDFICKLNNFSELEKTEEWKSLQAERPALAMEVVKSIVKYLQKK